MIDDIIAFIKARLDEREALTLAIQDQIGPEQNGSMVLTGEFGSLIYRFIDLDGALGDVEVKRRIVDMAEKILHLSRRGSAWHQEVGLAPTERETDNHVHTLRLLALPYAAHPDYRQVWRP